MRKSFNLILIFFLILIIPLICYSSDAKNCFALDVPIIENSDISILSFSSGDGTSENPYIINNAADMISLSAEVAAGQNYSGSFFKVADGISNIYLGNYSPIGISSEYPFKGTFNGNGVNFDLDIVGANSYAALFGYITQATIENFSVSGSITGNSNVAGVVAYQNGGTVRNVYNTASITATGNYVSGIVGYVREGYIDCVYNKGAIQGGSYVGGIAGACYGRTSKFYSRITNAYNASTIAGNLHLGGVIGHNSGYDYANDRANLYYDLATIANHVQPDALNKPTQAVSNITNVNNVKGLHREEMLKDMAQYGFDSSWQYDSQSGYYAYYPQLCLFSDNNNIGITQISKSSVEIYVKDGLGTVNYPFLIRNASYIEDLKNKIIHGNTFSGFYFKVLLDGGVDTIDLGDFVPIGDDAHPFHGSFDGNNTEFVLAINKPTTNYMGLFGYFGTGTIQNLSVKGSVYGANYVGGVVGRMVSGTIMNVYNTANISAEVYVGGVVGYMDNGTVQKSYNVGNVTAIGNYAGGLIGYVSYGNISYIYNTGSILGVNHIGGLIGYTNGTTSKKYSTVSFGYNIGTVAGNSTTYIGGVIGYGAGYPDRGNVRSNLYYDISVMVNFSPPTGKTKPIKAFGLYDNVTTVKGLYGESMLALGLGSHSFAETDWLFKETENGQAYYPQLIVFSESLNSRISVQSQTSVTVDVSGGLGTESIPFLITSTFDMTELSRRVSEGNTFNGFFFKVADGISNIYLGDYSPIGISSDYTFKGTFNGNGVNFDLDIVGANSYAALFGYITQATIENFSVSGSITGNSNVAGVVAYQNGGTVRNVYNTASITATGNYVSGIVGYVREGYIDCVYNKGAIQGGSYVGGIAGACYGRTSKFYSRITNAYNASTIAGNLHLGGVIGHNSGYDYANDRANLYYDLATIANHVQPIGLNKPTQAVSNIVNVSKVKGITMEELVGDMSSYGLATDAWHFSPVADSYAYYPQLKVFHDSDVEEIVLCSINSVKIFVGDGLGTVGFPFLIRNREDIEDLKNKIIHGNTFSGFYFKVLLDGGVDTIDLGDFVPIGNDAHPFHGSFDGNNTEFVLAINKPTTNYMGLFGYFGTGTIQNLSVKGSVYGANYVGGVVGRMVSGTIMNVYNTANISAEVYVGGVVGYMDNGTVQKSYNVGNVTAIGNYAGGLIGYVSYGNISYIYNTGSILGVNHIGGLIGYTNGTTSKKYSTVSFGYNIGTVAGNSTTYIGGVIGYGAGYPDRGNVRSNLYYDISVMVNFSPPTGKTKPIKAFGLYDNVTTVKGLYGESMLALGLGSHSFAETDWLFKETENGQAYYPQLIVFSESLNSRISVQSQTSVTVDVSGGLGTESIPFLITSTFDMTELSRRVSEGNTFNGFFFKVADGISNIYLGDYSPIGISSDYTFKGTFNGNGVNFDLDIVGANSYAALFGYITQATIENFSVSGSITGNSNVAGVVAYQNGGTVRNVYNTASITATGNYVSGIVGYVREGYIDCVYNKGAIQGGSYVGGIAGACYGRTSKFYSRITNAYNASTIAGNLHLGGVIGHNSGYDYANDRANLYYDLATIANHVQPIGLNKPTQAVSNIVNVSKVKGITMEELVGDMSSYGLATDAWHFSPVADSYAYYPQLKVFHDSDVEEIVLCSINSVKIFVGDGLGTVGFPFLIRNREDIEDLKNKIIHGNTFSGFYFKVLLDGGVDTIDLGDFVPIGNDAHPFHGSFDGNNTEFVLAINKPTTNYMGLFGYFGTGTIQNLSVKGSVYGANYVGGVVGRMVSGTIMNVYNTANISAEVYVGGVVGYMDNGTVQKSYNVGNVTAIGNYAGGLIGYVSYGNISYIYNTGSILGVNHIGGLIGYTNGTTSKKYSTVSFGYNIGTVAGNSTTYIGGVIGYGAGYSDRGNVRSYLYYDTDVMDNYIPPSGKFKPIRAFGLAANNSNVKGLTKGMMIAEGMLSHGFNVNDWAFCENEGRWAYYPQIRNFAYNQNNRISDESKLYVRTIPFIGKGTEESPYIISTVLDVMTLSRSISADYDARGVYYLVASNLVSFDLSNEDFYGIGGENAPFNGHFEGNYANFIVNISINLNCIGLFGYLGQYGSISNLSVSGSIVADSYVGAVVGMNFGVVQNVYSTTEIAGNQIIGGLIGDNHGVLSVGYNRGKISASGNYAGGIVGYNSGSIQEVYNGSLVDARNYAGGIVGFEDGGATIKAYYNYTLIQYYNPASGIKPSAAIANKTDTQSVLGMDKEYIVGLNIIGQELYKLNFDSDVWLECQSSGMYDYYLQISGFANNLNPGTSQLSSRSARSIKFDIGSGIEIDPFIIQDKYDMKILCDVSAQDTLAGIYFKVDDGVGTIDLSEEQLDFYSIGSSSYNFRGIFDGNNVNFVINMNGSGNYCGLFGFIGEGAAIKNLSVSGWVSGNNYVGGIAGYIYKSSVENVYNQAEVSGASYISGLVGYAHSSQITNSYNLANVISTANNVGGITGYATQTTISYTYNYGVISGVSYIGGISGRSENNLSILFSYNRNNVIGTSNYVGGITGYLLNGIIDNCYSAGVIRGLNQSYLGGLVGRSSSTAETNSYYDITIIEADSTLAANKPIRCVGNKLDQEDLKGVGKAYITGNNIELLFDYEKWTLVENNGIDAFYPQLKVFASNIDEHIQNHSIISVCSYVFAGKGEEWAPYIIINENDMKTLSNLVALGNDFENIYFSTRINAQEFDLSIPGLGYQSIGSQSMPFNGIFNGNGVNFFVDINGNDYVGLFGYLGSNAVVYQLSVSGNLYANNYVGSVAGYSQGNVHTVYSIAKVNGENYVGGIIGYNSGSLSSCYYISEIIGADSYTGGLIGYNNSGDVSQSYVAAKITGQNHIGGLIGYQNNSSTLLNLYYNKSIVEIQNINPSNKPSKAISNMQNTETCCGAFIENMTSGLLNQDSSISLDEELWFALSPFGFDIYYPQISYFSQHSLERIRDNSKNSVTVDRFTEGDGSQDNPYIIRTAMDMKAVSDLVYSKKTLEGKYFLVAQGIEEIDLTDPTVNYIPIGNDSCYFQGNFDGNGVMFILNLSSSSYYQGLFGFVGNNAIIKNISVSGSVSGRRFAGGIAARNRGIIESCYNNADIQVTEYYAGGIVGYNENIIRYCYNTATVRTTTNHYAGGIAAYTVRNTLIEFCYNTGTIISASHHVGGIAGYSEGKISNTYSAAEISGLSSGGIIGSVNSYATTFKSYYDITKVLVSELTRKPTAAISNIAQSSTVCGVVTSQLTGANLYKVQFDEGGFILVPNEGSTAYYPQIMNFAQSSIGHVRQSSLLSVTTTIFIGQGTSENPYYIINEADMKALGSLVSYGIQTEDVYFQVYYSQSIMDLSDISLNYKAIGTIEKPFNGVFLGNNAQFILNINSSNNYQGLFGYTGSSSVIQDISANGRVYGGEYVGFVTGYNQGHILNVTVYDAEVAGLLYAAGIAGRNDGIIENAYFDAGSIYCSGDYAGGITAFNNGTMIYCYNFANITSTANYVGGLTGHNNSQASISNSFNHGDVQGKQFVAGIVGVNYGDIEIIYNTADIKATTSHAGGITAINDGIIQGGYHSGQIATLYYAGGVAAINNGTLNNLYYNTSETEKIAPDSSYILVVSAVSLQQDTDSVKGLILEAMTGFEAISVEGMNLNYELWALREGQDFKSYFPEMLYFKNHQSSYVREQSLISVTDNKYEGEGTENNPYLIYDGYDMKTLDEYLLRGNLFTGKQFKVADGVSVIDLSFSELEFTPIGDMEMRFGGIFNGNGANFVLNLENSNQDYQGIFHTIGNTAKVYDLSVSGQVTGKSYVGSIAGRCLGTIDNVINNAIINSNDGNNVGGITGFNEGVIKYSANKASVIMRGTYGGGIAGENTGSISDCYNKATVSGVTNIGGIAGRNFNSITRTYNTADIIAETQVGGITGENDYKLSQSFNMGSVKATIGIAGGISGAQRAKGDGSSPEVSVVYNTGCVQTVSNHAGGIIAHLVNGRLIDSYNGGDVSGVNEIGVIVGINENGNVLRSYYDINHLENFEPTTGIKPTQAVGNLQDNDSVKGLFRGQMAGIYSIGNKTNQMNFSSASSFVTTPSYDQWSFYPQIKVFSNNENEEIKADSLESVRGLTFVVGTGTESDPYIIMNESDMIALAQTVNSGNEYEGKYFMVDANKKEFSFSDGIFIYLPVGNQEWGFKGNLNGNGANFDIEVSYSYDYVALFGHIGENGYVYDLSVSGNISGYNYTAGIAAFNEGTIKNVYNQAIISGRDYTAGIVAKNNGQIINVYNNGDIAGYNYSAGISGFMDGNILNSYNTGVIYGKNNVGAIVGFLNTGLAEHSFYDTRILGAYRDVGALIKPIRGVSNSTDSQTVKGLDKQFMVGTNAIGSGELQINFDDTNNEWGYTYNIDGQQNYPQLRVFSRSSSSQIKALSKQSTLTNLYTICFDYNGATENNSLEFSYAINGRHYQLGVPFKYGFEFTGWYYIDEEFSYIKTTDKNGLSLQPYGFEENISLTAQWQQAYHLVEFIDGNNHVIDSVSILHGDYAAVTQEIPTKSSSLTQVFLFEQWDYDFTQRIVERTKIYAKYTAKERYYKLTYLDGNNQFFKEQRVEYANKATEISDIPVKMFVDNTAYKFISWDFDFSTEIYQHYSINPVFEEVERWYTVTFVNYDYSLIEEQTIEYMKPAFAPLTLVERPSDQAYNYEFCGWDKEYNSIDENLIVIAQFEEITRQYAVIFFDGNGDIFDSQSIEYSQSAAEPYGLPMKESHDNIAYRFVDWDKDFSCIIADTAVHASFVSVDRYYQVAFANYDGSVIYTDTVEYLCAAVAPQQPTRDAEEQYIYIFSNWDNPFDCITENITVTAVFERSLRPFSVLFIDGDNNVFTQQAVLYGQNAVVPTGTPTKTPVGDFAFKFTNWEGALTNITQDTEIYAKFVEVQRYYFVTFYGYDTSVVLKSERVEYGQSANAPQPPIPTHANISYEYYFVNWDKDISFIQTDLVVTAVYSSRMKSFSVTFVNGDETTSQTVNYGQSAVAPEPVKTGDLRISYEFIEWDNEYTNVIQDMTVTAIFEAVYNFYIVTFINGDGSVIEQQQVLKGDTANAPVAYKNKTENKVYVFSEWDINFTDVESDLTVYSLFNEYDRYYDVVFLDADNNVYDEQIVEYAFAANAPEIAPQKESTYQYQYIFLGWDKEFANITECIIISPVYEQRLRSFEVDFINGDNFVISSQLVQYGHSATAPSTATKSPDDEHCFIFNGWDMDFVMITADTQVRALFTEVDRWYTVTFVGKDDVTLDRQIVEYQNSAYDPIRDLEYQEVDDDYLIAIVGWDKSFDNIISNLIVNAIYTQVDRWYLVKFYDEDASLLKEQVVEYGHDATPPSAPEKVGDENYRYEFAGWDDDNTFITQNKDIYATYIRYNNRYTVKFFDGNGALFEEQTVFYGLDAIQPDGIPTKTSSNQYTYSFTGWDKPFTNIRENKEIFALFDEQIRYYTVRFMDTNNILLKEESVQYGLSATPPQGIIAPEQTEEFYYEISWSQAYNKIVSNMQIQLIFVAVTRQYTYTFLDAEGNSLKSVLAPYGAEIIAPSAPDKAMTEKYVYTFICWNPEPEQILTKDITFEPYYDENIREYSIIFLDADGEIFDKQSVPYGSNGVFPENNPEKTGDQQYYYEFRMWDSYPNSIRSDTTIRPIFNSFLQMYTVTFADEKDNVLKIHKVPYGTGATEPDPDLIPKKADTPMYIYTFIGWSRPFSNVTEDIVVKTVYIGVLRSYTYTFYDEDRITIIKQVRGIYGSTIIAPPDPQKPNTDQTKYVFIGWDKVVADLLIEDIDYYAVYEEQLKSYTVIFYDGDDFAVNTQIVNHGQAASTPEIIPTKTMNQIYQYVFENWVEDYSCITENLKVYPTFTQKLREYTVTFVGHNNQVTEVFVEYGKSAEGKVATPQRKGYRFINWDKDISVIYEDTTVRSIFAPNQYQINFNSENADNGYMQPIVSTFDQAIELPLNEYTRLGYMFVGWQKEDSAGQIVYLHDGQSFVLKDEGADLYARWIPVVYDITYHLDGGMAVNPETYTIEDRILLQSAHKQDHKFIGWFRQPKNQTEPQYSSMSIEFSSLFFSSMSQPQEPELPVDEPINEIPQGTMGQLELYAFYEFDGYITLKEDSHLKFIVADGLVTTELEERAFYDEENPIYVKGITVNMTVGQLKEHFINDGIVVLKADGTVLDDAAKLATGCQMVLYDENYNIKDKVIIYILGDLDGNGIVNALDAAILETNIESIKVKGEYLLAADLNENTIFNALDYNALLNLIS